MCVHYPKACLCKIRDQVTEQFLIYDMNINDVCEQWTNGGDNNNWCMYICMYTTQKYISEKIRDKVTEQFMRYEH